MKNGPTDPHQTGVRIFNEKTKAPINYFKENCKQSVKNYNLKVHRIKAALGKRLNARKRYGKTFVKKIK